MAPRALLILLIVATVSCRSLFSHKYEYDEEIYLALDGSATIYINASVPALVALRGLPFDLDPHARFDRRAARAVFETPVTHVESLTSSRRDNRRYLHVRLRVPDVRRLAEAPPFQWSTFSIAPEGDILKYHQLVGASAGKAVGDVGWTGNELVAFRLHLPSRVPFHNSPAKTIERGNIISWEQPLTERLHGRPIDIEVHLERQSILVQTLALFGSMVALAALTFAIVIWLVFRKGRPDSPVEAGL